MTKSASPQPKQLCQRALTGAFLIAALFPLGFGLLLWREHGIDATLPFAEKFVPMIPSLAALIAGVILKQRGERQFRLKLAQGAWTHEVIDETCAWLHSGRHTRLAWISVGWAFLLVAAASFYLGHVPSVTVSLLFASALPAMTLSRLKQILCAADVPKVWLDAAGSAPLQSRRWSQPLARRSSNQSVS